MSLWRRLPFGSILSSLLGCSFFEDIFLRILGTMIIILVMVVTCSDNENGSNNDSGTTC